jgi:hypothetical protein
MVDWARLRTGSSQGRRHTIAPDAELTESGSPALCGRWLTDIDDASTVWDPRGPHACLVCREKQRQVLDTLLW